MHDLQINPIFLLRKQSGMPECEPILPLGIPSYNAIILYNAVFPLSPVDA